LKLTHKLAKLVSREAYTRAARRINRNLHPIPLQPLLDKIDRDQLAQIQARHAGSKKYPAKYCRDMERWLHMNIPRVQDLNLHRSPPQDVLDLGCGGGFFLFICQQFGHRCLGIDMDEHPLFGELVALFGVERRVWKIKACEPLPDLGRTFDYITAFSIGFNRNPDKTLWGPDEWQFFLNDLEQRHLKPGGKIFLGLNPQLDGWFYTDELRDFFVRRGATVERERILFEKQIR
jgi:SAM-dependent methyltransferase